VSGGPVPQRLQRKRTKGYRLPEGAAYVGRPTEWGNPWKPGDACDVRCDSDGGPWWSTVQSPEHAALVFRAWLLGRPDMQRRAREELAGRDLACWCPLDQPCHADVLLEVANR
jgi:hypothetical protein